MMSSQHQEEILALLRADVVLQAHHGELLEKQKIALIACNRPDFMNLQALYEALVSEFEKQEHRREKLLPFNGPKLIKLIDSWEEPRRSEASQLIEKLKALAANAKQRSRENRKLVENELNFVEFELDLIMNAARKGSHYAKSGASAPAMSNRLLNRVA